MTYQRHPLDIGALVFGLIFLGVVAAWGLFALGIVSGDDAAWLLPFVLIGAGALGVVLAVTKERRGDRVAEPHTTGPHTTEPHTTEPLERSAPEPTQERRDD